MKLEECNDISSLALAIRDQIEAVIANAPGHQTAMALVVVVHEFFGPDTEMFVTMLRDCAKACDADNSRARLQ